MFLFCSHVSPLLDGIWNVMVHRIERVEPGLAADLAGMRVADYIVFVGSYNVVKMDEEQVLQLIQ